MSCGKKNGEGAGKRQGESSDHDGSLMANEEERERRCPRLGCSLKKAGHSPQRGLKPQPADRGVLCLPGMGLL